MKIFDLIEQGGIVMWPLFIVGVWAFYLIVIKVIDLIQINHRNKKFNFIQTTDQTLQTNEQGNMYHYLQDKTPIERILKVGVDQLKINDNERFFKEKLESSYEKEIVKLEQGMSMILILGEIMPMLGLLGTVSGMIHVFQAITAYGTGDAQALAGGISEALLTTQVGLVLAIPTMFCYTALTNQIDKIASELKKAGEVLSQHFYQTHPFSGQTRESNDVQI